MLHPKRHHNTIPPSHTPEAAMDTMTDARDQGLDPGSGQLWGRGLEDTDTGHGGFEADAPNGTKCVKVAPFWVEESQGHLGPGRCRNDCDCCGARTCSQHGFCLGDAVLAQHPDCVPVARGTRVFATPATAAGHFADLRNDAEAMRQQIEAEGAAAAAPASDAARERERLHARINIQRDFSHDVDVDSGILAPGVVDGEDYAPIADRGLGMTPKYAERIEGILDNAGMGLRSHEQGVTNPN